MFRKLLDRGEAGDNAGLLLAVSTKSHPPWYGYLQAR
jgi:translation elongation factor EF-Tu-like GTPase